MGNTWESHRISFGSLRMLATMLVAERLSTNTCTHIETKLIPIYRIESNMRDAIPCCPSFSLFPLSLYGERAEYVCIYPETTFIRPVVSHEWRLEICLHFTDLIFVGFSPSFAHNFTLAHSTFYTFSAVM